MPGRAVLIFSKDWWQWCAVQVYVEDNSVNIIIDGNDANTLKTHLYRGAGMVSGNNSSRLLLDYKAQNPDKYWKY